MGLSERTEKYIRKNQMTAPGETLCIGLSGGADSVCLTVLLSELAGRLGIRITAFHVNHLLRGKDSDEDEEFVRTFCKDRQIPLRVFRYDIRTEAEKRKRGIEEIGRLMRRKAAAEAAAGFGASKIALAHHANDNAETVLFHLARGSSLSGLKGILPVSGNVIRPLLFAERFEIEEELKLRGLPWREDLTNRDCDYSRNRIRSRILPELSDFVNSGAVRHISEAAADLAEADRILDQAAKERLAAFSENKDRGILLKNGILTDSRLINGKIVLAALSEVTGQAADLERIHAEELCGLFEKQTGRRIELPYRTDACRVYEGILITGGTEEKPAGKGEEEEEIMLPENGTAEFRGLRIRTELLRISDLPEKIPRNRYTKWLDYDKISRYGRVRTGRKGDYLVINSEGGRKKLGDYFINEKIPLRERPSVVCLARGSEILWVIGHRIGESAKVTENTRNVIRIEVTGDGIHE